MLQKFLISLVIFAGIGSVSTAQNFSGLLDKKLPRADHLNSGLESLFGRLGGSVDGSIDSVVVTGDHETELHLMIYYTDFVNGYFTVSTMNAFRKGEPYIESVKFSQSERNSPAECILMLKAEAVTEPLKESPLLRIEIAKKANGKGKVKVFFLQKKWSLTAEEIIPVPDTDTTEGIIPAAFAVTATTKFPFITMGLPAQKFMSASPGSLLLAGKKEDEP